MKNKTEFYKRWWFWVIIILALLLNVGFALLSPSNNANIFTAVSGWISAIATIVLGCIAVWQNKRYKELSDDMTDLMLMPDFFFPKAQAEQRTIGGNDSYNEFSFVLEDGESFCGVIKQGFAIVRPPIVNFNISKLSCSGETFIYNHKEEYSLYLPTTTGFFLKFQIPSVFLSNDNDYCIVFEFENTFGNKYTKNGSFHIQANSSIISNLKLEKARRK